MNQSEPLLCGIDLGGTKISIALVRRDGTIHASRQIRDHRGQPPERVVESIAASVSDLMRASGVAIESIQGVGVGTAGHVDYHTGTLIINSNLPGFEAFPLGERLRTALDTPVFLDNDANAQAYAEYRFGAGRGYDNMSFVTVSTGVGAGLIIGGSVYRGVTGIAGEIGHTIVEPSGSIRCGCGRTGCLMAYTSGLTLPQVVREVLDREQLSASDTRFDFASMPDARITGELIGTGLAEGDRFCRRIVEQYADYLAIGLNNLYQVIDPGLFVVGGGLSAWGPAYIDRVRTQFASLVERMSVRTPEIRVAQLGTDAAVIGAAALPLER